ncbi:hypothetical protein BKA65DRAFT_479956 [Rhexocercosporidium sp. MPI-PUGE-AT-0058]|nr:hypothetical protein BKA65DRAFT_479956 [Rhexocercosporidium sp. MPI-PUGE-AT-0058]
MPPGRHDTCPCCYTWKKSQDADGYICRGGHHMINGRGETPGEAAWAKQQAADRKKAEDEDAKRQDQEKQKERTRQVAHQKVATPEPILETDAARARRESREREVEDLKASRLKQEISARESPLEVKQATKSTSRKKTHSSSQKFAKTRQQRQDEETRINKEKEQQRRQDYLDAESAAERSQAWARINATHAAGPSTPISSPQTTRRPQALPAPPLAPVIKPMP